MNSSNYQANSFIELAEEIKSGELSLKDLYYSQLISDVEHLNDAIFTDVEVDPDYYKTDDHLNSFHPLVNFEFTKNVMSQIRDIAKAKQISQQPSHENQDSYKPTVFHGFNIPKNLTEPEYVHVGNYIPQSGHVSTNTNYQGFYSESIESTNSSASSNIQPNNIELSDVITTLDSSNDSTIFTRVNVLVAFIAFVLTLITISLTNIYKNNDNGFSTLASNNQVSTQQHQAMKQILEQKPILITSKKLEPEYTFNFGTTPIDTGVKLISFSKTTPISSIVLREKQATNLSILFNNFEIQKRLAK